MDKETSEWLRILIPKLWEKRVVDMYTQWAKTYKDWWRSWK